MNAPRFALRTLQLLALVGLPACEQFMNGPNVDLAAAPDLAVPTRFGMIRVTGTTTGSSGIAAFVDHQQPSAGCLRRVEGDCMLYHCDGTSFVQPNAGTIAIAGGAMAVNLVARPDGSYIPYVSSSQVTFAAGTKLSFDAPGGIAPMLHLELTPPNHSFAVTEPDGTRPQIIFNINRQRDYRMTWTALGAGARVHVELSQDTDSNRASILECDFDGMAGQGVMPRTLLTGFLLTDAGTLSHVANFYIAPSTNANMKSGGWDVVAYGMANGRDGRVSIVDN
jgi:hypothetical protein